MGSFSALNLVVVQGLRHGDTLEYQPGASIRIGRVVRGNTLPIKDAGISTKHLCIEFEFDSAKWVVRDLDSSNGTFLNGACLTPNTAFDLNDGDSIKIGEETSILIKIDCQAKSQVRRNPKRRAAAKDGSIGAVVETRGRMAMEESAVDQDVEGDCNMALDSRMQGRERKARGLKSESCDQTEGKKLLGPITGDSQNSGRKGMVLKDSTFEYEVEEDKSMLPDGRRNGRQRKGRFSKDENAIQTEVKKTDDTLLGVKTCEVRNRSRKGMALKDSIVNHEDDGDKIMLVESQKGGKPRKGRVLKDKNGDKGGNETVELFGVIKGDSEKKGRDGTALKNSTVEHQALGDKIMEVGKPRKGRPRKGRVLKDENCDEVEGKKDCNILAVSRRHSHIKGPIQGNIGVRMSTRRNRAAKGYENAVEKSILSKIPENMCLEAEKGGVQVRRTRASGKGRNKLSEELLDNVEVDNLEDNNYSKQKGLHKVATKDAIKEMENINVRVSTIVSDAFEHEDRNENEEQCSVHEGSVNVEIDSKTDVKENKGAEKLDLEKMTVGDWFNYLEVHLPAQIIDETENYVERIKKKAARVREDVLKQKKEKRNQPLA